MNYYNEFDAKAAAWLRELINAGLIPPGDVDTRSITEVSPDDLRKYTQCHFFAGIAGWPLALQLAGWPSTRPVWTGSCPCQPFSVAGKGLGEADERHLWPVFANLIRECRPPVVFGEQVASKAGLGWLDGVCTDLEGADYAVGAADLCAASASPEVAGWLWIPDEAEPAGGLWVPASAGPPHIRQRLFWVADAGRAGIGRDAGAIFGAESESTAQGALAGGVAHEPLNGGAVGGLADTDLSSGGQGSPDSGGRITGSNAEARAGLSGGGDHRGLAHSTGGPTRVGRIPGAEEGEGRQHRNDHDGCGRGLGHPERPGLEGHPGHGDDRHEPGRLDASATGPVTPASGDSWSRFDLIPCADGKTRRIEPGLAPLVAGLPRGVVPGGDPCREGYAQNTAEARVTRLRGYGNSIVPQLAAEFINAYRLTSDHAKV